MRVEAGTRWKFLSFRSMHLTGIEEFLSIKLFKLFKKQSWHFCFVSALQAPSSIARPNKRGALDRFSLATIQRLSPKICPLSCRA